MATIFPGEEKTDLLFHKIPADPEACRSLTQTVCNQMDQYGDEPHTLNVITKIVRGIA